MSPSVDKARDEWMPIETAPRGNDGRWIMLWVVPGRLDTREPAGPVFATWDSVFRETWVDEGGCDITEKPTHWQPLPKPPVQP